MLTQSQARRALLVNVIVGTPTLMNIFPLVKGLGFTGNLGDAVIAMVVATVANIALCMATTFLLGLVGILSRYDSQRKTIAVLFLPSVAYSVWILWSMNGHFGISFDSVNSASIGVLILWGISSFVNRTLEHLDE